MIPYVISCIIGILSGVFTGLVPGIHPNTVMFTSLPVYLSTDIGQGMYIAYVTGISVSHTFHDFLPAIFLSAPDAESALSVVAAPDMVKKGKGLEAFHATVKGGINAFATVIFLAVPLFFLLDPLYSFISGSMPGVLLFFLLYIILSSEDFFNSLVIAGFSGVLGVISFGSGVNQQFVLIPVFTGLFAVPGLYSIYFGDEFAVPDQKESDEKVFEVSSHGVVGAFAGLIAGTIPGVGAAVSTSFLSPFIGESKTKFLEAMGAVNTSDILFSLLTLWLLGKARSGASVALQALLQPTGTKIISVIGLAAFSVLIAAPLSLKVSRSYVRLIEDLKIQKVILPVAVILLIVVIFLTGLKGLLILSTASLIGTVAQRTDQRKACMAVLIIPSILSFMGVTIFM